MSEKRKANRMDDRINSEFVYFHGSTSLGDVCVVCVCGVPFEARTGVHVQWKEGEKRTSR